MNNLTESLDNEEGILARFESVLSRLNELPPKEELNKDQLEKIVDIFNNYEEIGRGLLLKNSKINLMSGLAKVGLILQRFIPFDQRDRPDLVKGKAYALAGIAFSEQWNQIRGLVSGYMTNILEHREIYRKELEKRR